MKRILLALLICSSLICSSIAGFSQTPTANKIPQFVYCEILGYSRLMSVKITVDIDFGEKRNIWADNRIKDPKTGKKRIFNSMVDALNFMGKQGWEFVQAYAVTTGNSNVYRWLLKKPFADLDPEDQKLEMKEDGDQ